MIGLNDVQPAVGQQPAEGVDAVLLLASRNGNRKGIGHLLGAVEPVEEHRLLDRR